MVRCQVSYNVQYYMVQPKMKVPRPPNNSLYLATGALWLSNIDRPELLNYWISIVSSDTSNNHPSLILQLWANAASTHSLTVQLMSFSNVARQFSRKIATCNTSLLCAIVASPEKLWDKLQRGQGMLHAATNLQLVSRRHSKTRFKKTCIV